MKVLQKGSLTKPKNIKLFTCKNCGCIFEADNTEYEERDGYRNDSYYVITCPTKGCNAECYC